MSRREEEREKNRHQHKSKGAARDRSRSRSRSRSPKIKLNDSVQKEMIIERPKPTIQIISKNRVRTNIGIQMKLGQKPKVGSVLMQKPKLTVAAAFNNDSDDEPEEMPPEAKMRMRNIGRDTPTSSGPNSFGKTKQGFSDSKKVFEKNLKEAMDGEGE